MKCPYCGQPLEYTDTIDTEECNEQYIQTETHYCKNAIKLLYEKLCGRWFMNMTHGRKYK